MTVAKKKKKGKKKEKRTIFQAGEYMPSLNLILILYSVFVSKMIQENSLKPIKDGLKRQNADLNVTVLNWI